MSPEIKNQDKKVLKFDAFGPKGLFLSEGQLCQTLSGSISIEKEYFTDRFKAINSMIGCPHGLRVSIV